MSKESLNTITDVIKNHQKKYSKSTDRIRTGSLLLDLVIGGGEGLGFPPGKIINVVGDKSSGKTFLACEIIAANFHQYKKRFHFNYDDGECGFTFDTKTLYGVEILGESLLQSKTIEEFDVNTGRFLKKIKDDAVGIYVLDSLDGLSNDDIEERADKRMKAADAGKEFKEGTYGMKTPKFLSQEFFRTKTSDFAGKNTNLIIISQVRENIDPMSFKKWARSGGKALDFYAHTCLWLATIGKIKRNGRVVGVVIKAHTDKSKTARPFRECEFTVYFDYGVDNIGSCLDYLYDLRGKDGQLKSAAESICWSGQESTLDTLKSFLEAEGKKDTARDAVKKETGKSALSKEWIIRWIGSQPEMKAKYDEKFGIAESREALIQRIEAEPDMMKELESRVIEKWERAEAEILSNRKRKYS